MDEGVILCLSGESFLTLKPGELPQDLVAELMDDLAELGAPSSSVRFEQGTQGHAAEGATVLAIITGLLSIGPAIELNLRAWPAVGKRLRRTLRGLRKKGYSTSVSQPASLALALEDLDRRGVLTDADTLLASHVIPVQGSSIPENLRDSLRRQPDRFYLFVVRTEDQNTHVIVTRSSGALEHHLRLPTGDWTEYYGAK